MFKIIKKIIKDSKNTTNELEIKTKQILQEKYSHFQNLLATNNYVLNIMADLEEKFGGEYLFDMHYVKTNTKLISYEVKRIINYQQRLRKNKQ
jgi:pyruvate,water dikinase